MTGTISDGDFNLITEFFMFFQAVFTHKSWQKTSNTRQFRRNKTSNIDWDLLFHTVTFYTERRQISFGLITISNHGLFLLDFFFFFLITIERGSFILPSDGDLHGDGDYMLVVTGTSIFLPGAACPTRLNISQGAWEIATTAWHIVPVQRYISSSSYRISLHCQN